MKRILNWVTWLAAMNDINHLEEYNRETRGISKLGATCYQRKRPNLILYKIADINPKHLARSIAIKINAIFITIGFFILLIVPSNEEELVWNVLQCLTFFGPIFYLHLVILYVSTRVIKAFSLEFLSAYSRIVSAMHHRIEENFSEPYAPGENGIESVDWFNVTTNIENIVHIID